MYKQQQQYTRIVKCTYLADNGHTQRRHDTWETGSTTGEWMNGATTRGEHMNSVRGDKVGHEGKWVRVFERGQGRARIIRDLNFGEQKRQWFFSQNHHHLSFP